MAHTYLEIFNNFTKSLFNRIFELFNHKVLPNVPNNNSGWCWFQKYKAILGVAPSIYTFLGR